MGSWRKVGAFLGLVPDEGRRDEFGDEYPEADGYRDDYDASDRHASDYQSAQYQSAQYRGDDFDRGHDAPYPAPRSVSGGYGDDHATHGALAMQARSEQRREPEAPGAIRPITVKLTGFGEARVIGEKFREGKPVILDMTEMDDAGARRLVDFAAGLAFALRGSIDKVTTKVFMLLPPDTDAADIPAYEPTQAAYSGGFGAETPGRERQAYAGARAGR